MKFQINITQDVLNATKDCNDNTDENCAIAHAIRDLFPEASVGCSTIYFKKDLNKPFDFHDNRKAEEIDLPLIAMLFIKDFDNKSPEERVKIKPFSFFINIPDSLIEEINISEIEDILSHSQTLQIA